MDRTRDEKKWTEPEIRRNVQNQILEEMDGTRDQKKWTEPDTVLEGVNTVHAFTEQNYVQRFCGMGEGPGKGSKRRAIGRGGQSRTMNRCGREQDQEWATQSRTTDGKKDQWLGAELGDHS